MILSSIAERGATGSMIANEITGILTQEPRTLLQESWRDFVFAEVRSRPGLDRRSRFVISLASAASIPGPQRLLDNYVRGARTLGELTLAELREITLHLAVYASWSIAENLDEAISRVAEGLSLDQDAFPHIRASDWDADARTAEGKARFQSVMKFGGPPPTTPYFSAGILNFVFGEIWCRPGLDQRARRWITLVGVADSCARVPIGSHFHSAMTSGDCQPDELQEFVLQYAIHAGWPKASVIQGVVLEMIRKFEAGAPWDS